MPVFKDADIYFGGYDLSSVGNEVSIDAMQNPVPVTTFSSGGNVALAGGIKNYPVAVMTYLDQSAVGTFLGQAQGTTDVLSVVPWPSNAGVPAVGDAVYAGRTLLLTHKDPMKVGDAAQINVSGSVAANEGLLNGKLLFPLANVSSSSTGTIYNYGAQASPKVCYFGIHVTTVTGTATITAKLQSAALVGFGSPTDRVTLGAISAIGSGFGSSATATTDAFWRVNYTIAGTGTVSFTAFMSIQ